jgi:hypothetical protein
VKDIELDVELHIRNADIVDFGDSHAASKEIINRLRIKAEQVCRDAGQGVELRMDRAPEIVTKQAFSAILGGDYFLVAARWPCTAPDSFDPSRQPAT